MVKLNKNWKTFLKILFLLIAIYFVFIEFLIDKRSNAVFKHRIINSQVVSIGSSLQNIIELKKSIENLHDEALGFGRVCVISCLEMDTLFIKGKTVSWYGYLPDEEILIERPYVLSRLSLIPLYKNLIKRLLYTGKLNHKLKDTNNEKFIFEKILFWKYFRFNIKRRVGYYSIDFDELIKVFEVASKAQHLHIHCKCSKGRSTFMIILYDMYLNHHKDSFDEIVERNCKLSGIDITNTTVWKNGTYSKKDLCQRYKKLKSFYTYLKNKKSSVMLESDKNQEDTKFNAC